MAWNPHGWIFYMDIHNGRNIKSCTNLTKEENMEPQSILSYLRTHLDVQGDFVREFRNLSQKDHDDLKAYTVTEMNILGIPVKD